MIIQPIKLTTSDNILKEKYDSGNIVLATCDATDGSFVIDMPDCGDALNTLFVFNKIDGLREKILTLNPILGQLIQLETEQQFRIGSVILWTDGLNYYTA